MKTRHWKKINMKIVLGEVKLMEIVIRKSVTMWMMEMIPLI